MSKLSDLIDTLEEAACDATERVRKAHSKFILAHYRELLSVHKLHNHKLVISSSCGSNTIEVNGKIYYGSGRRTRLDEIINIIYATMDWDWTCYLDGEQLNLDYIKKYPQDF